MRTRSFRRYKKVVKLRRAYNIFRYERKMSDKDAKRNAYLLVNNMQICSCVSCGNPRHSKWYNGIEKLTIQERRHLPDLEEINGIIV